MQSTAEPGRRCPTPPHYPYYGVHVSESEAMQILAVSIPEASFVGLTSLPDGSYYNNRVYRLQFTRPMGASPEMSILKVCGSASGRERPRNEVHVLRHIEATLPELSVPRIIAWSGQSSDAEAITKHSWIVMTLLQGQSLDSVPDVDELDSRCVFDDVAGFLHTLRTCSTSVGIGNLVGTKDQNTAAVLGPPVDSPALQNWPKKTYLEYMTALLEDGIAVREADSDYAEEKDLIPALSAFVDDTLPRLAIFSNDTINCSSVLTNCDLSAQNVIVVRKDHQKDHVLSESAKPQLRLSGIVDWEYAGYFSPTEEYLTASPEIFDLVPHPEDDIGDAYASCLLPALSARHVDTPYYGAFTTIWPEAQLLHRLRECIVPWWIRGLDEPERTQEIRETSRTVRSMIEQLSKSA